MNSPQPGFLLTRHWRDTPHGIELTFWLATDNGPVQLRVPLNRRLPLSRSRQPHRQLTCYAEKTMSV